MSRKHLRQLDLDQVIQGCSQESARFRAGRPGDEGHCFELFRRAAEENDPGAWDAIHSQYRQMVAWWIGDHHNNDELVASTFEKFWRATRGVHLSSRFNHVGALLSYLRKCALCVRLDLERQKSRRDRRDALYQEFASRAVSARDPALDNITHKELAASVHRWLDENLQDEHERQVVFLSYSLDLAPAEITRRHPELFPDVKTVRRVKDRVLKRLRRRAGELKKLVED